MMTERRRSFVSGIAVLGLSLGISVWGQSPVPKPNAANASTPAAATATPDTAAPDTGPPTNQDPGVSAGQGDAHGDLWRYLTSYEFALAALVIAFGLVIMLSVSYALKGRNATPEQLLRFYGVIVILIATTLLIIAGLNNNQIAPAVGLFGTVAGYLLGRGQSTEPRVNPETDKVSHDDASK